MPTLSFVKKQLTTDEMTHLIRGQIHDDITSRANLGSTVAERHLKNIVVVFLESVPCFGEWEQKNNPSGIIEEKWTDHHLNNSSEKKIVNADGHVSNFHFRVFLREKSNHD